MASPNSHYSSTGLLHVRPSDNPHGRQHRYNLIKPVGRDLVKAELLNRGTGYQPEQRNKWHILGLVPPAVETLEKQVMRVMELVRSLSTPLEKYMYLDRIRTESSTLFYKLVMENFKETIPIIYTPTISTICQQYSRIYTPGTIQGLFLSLQDEDRIDLILDNWPYEDPEICVLTDGSKVLGLGDIGVNGMAIAVAKVSLYVAAAGIHPNRTLPITIDVGTNNDSLLQDSLYLGTRASRPPQQKYQKFLSTVIKCIKARYPNILIQFEDISFDNAYELLEQNKGDVNDHTKPGVLCFSDDIQVTSAVVLAGFVNAIKKSEVSIDQHKVLFVGGGALGVSIAEQLLEHFIREGGLSVEEAKSHFYLMDSKGLVTTDRNDVANLPEFKMRFARGDLNKEQIFSILDAVKILKPSVLVGLTSQGGVFTDEILKLMGELNKRPIIFPLSNPITNVECTFENAMKQTQGRVLFVSGTSFPSCKHPTTGDEVEAAQANNM
ncbi:hypothetical protein HDU76_002503 [Blyttiomyces sp. JEL0837]|nr:hypothetical protein HDU76_002503 [Blyttiomyces sp. JEL0837]